MLHPLLRTPLLSLVFRYKFEFTVSVLYEFLLPSVCIVPSWTDSYNFMWHIWKKLCGDFTDSVVTLKDMGTQSNMSCLQLSTSRGFVQNISQNLADGTKCKTRNKKQRVFALPKSRLFLRYTKKMNILSTWFVIPGFGVLKILLKTDWKTRFLLLISQVVNENAAALSCSI